MAKFTRIIGITLIFLGVISYFGSGMVSITALIPTFFGIVFLILGIAARRESIYKHVMHGAAVLALLGLFGSGEGLYNIFVEPTDAAISKAVMAIICIIFLIAAIKSFIDARKAKET